jgi:hypothetical protein
MNFASWGFIMKQILLFSILSFFSATSMGEQVINGTFSVDNQSSEEVIFEAPFAGANESILPQKTENVAFTTTLPHFDFGKGGGPKAYFMKKVDCTLGPSLQGRRQGLENDLQIEVIIQSTEDGCIIKMKND